MFEHLVSLGSNEVSDLLGVSNDEVEGVRSLFSQRNEVVQSILNDDDEDMGDIGTTHGRGNRKSPEYTNRQSSVFYTKYVASDGTSRNELRNESCRRGKRFRCRFHTPNGQNE
mmetsp:Transcript_12856/g.15718  ORF Transcript_12856/g.15718 Transcript_12856/m.15718 type:complete len:113 (+) Transcript_12856:316-654(+)